MKNRFTRIIINDPFSVFRIIAWNLKTLFLKISGKKTIVFNIQMDYFFNVFEPVYEMLKQNPKIRIYFSCFEGHQHIRQYLKEFINPKFLLSSDISPFIYFDLFITAEVNGPNFPLSLLPTKRIQIYHGSGVYNLYTKKNVLENFDVHFAVGPKHVEFVKTLIHTKKYPNKFAIIGYPKLDAIVNPPKELISKLNNLYGIKDQFVILYTPHWNPYGSLHILSLEMITRLAKIENTLILIKVHNFLFARYKEDNWQKKLNDITEKLPNVIFVTRPNTQEIFPLGDMLITDTGTSAAFEYSLTNNPLFVFHNPDWFENNDFGNVESEIIDTAICFKQIDEIVELTQKLINKDDKLQNIIAAQQKKQQLLIEKYLFNPGNATPAAVKTICKELNLNEG